VSLRGKKGYARIYQATANLIRRRNSSGAAGTLYQFCARWIYGTHPQSQFSDSLEIPHEPHRYEYYNIEYVVGAFHGNLRNWEV
jgi:hypothetical protein